MIVNLWLEYAKRKSGLILGEMMIEMNSTSESNEMSRIVYINMFFIYKNVHLLYQYWRGRFYTAYSA